MMAAPRKLAALCALSAAATLLASVASAQLSGYSFAVTNETYSALTGATTLVPAAGDLDDGRSASLPLGFTFTFDGAAYTNIYISTNGFLQFDDGSGPPGTVVLRNVLSEVNSFNNITKVVSPLNHDFDATTSPSTIRYRTDTSGGVGNRVFEVEWSQVRSFNSTTQPSSITVKVRLLENGNKIEFRYGGVSGYTEQGSLTNFTPVGLRSGIATAATNVLAVASGTVGNEWTAPTTSTVNTTVMPFSSTSSTRVPASGVTYTFTPPSAPVATCADVSLQRSASLQNMLFNINLSGAPGATPIRINYATTAGTATPGTDYTTSSGQVVITTPSTAGSFSVPIAGFTSRTTTRQYTVTLTADGTSGPVAGLPITVTATILNNGALQPGWAYTINRLPAVNFAEFDTANVAGTYRSSAAPSTTADFLNGGDFQGVDYTRFYAARYGALVSELLTVDCVQNTVLSSTAVTGLPTVDHALTTIAWDPSAGVMRVTALNAVTNLDWRIGTINVATAATSGWTAITGTPGGWTASGMEITNTGTIYVVDGGSGTFGTLTAGGAWTTIGAHGVNTTDYFDDLAYNRTTGAMYWPAKSPNTGTITSQVWRGINTATGVASAGGVDLIALGSVSMRAAAIVPGGTFVEDWSVR